MFIKTFQNYSPNFSTYRRNPKNIKYIIYHYTGMSSESKAINRLTNDRSKVSCHYFIKRDGLIILMVPEIYEAWHAGVSKWKKDNFLNKNSIGIEISNRGHNFGYQKFTKPQLNSIIKLSKYLIKKYNIKKKNILGHSDIAFNRKKDPGEKFPWEKLSNNKIGIWHKIKKNKLLKLRNKKVSNQEIVKYFLFLQKYGYPNKIKGSLNKTKLIKSFQRRFRQQLINGKIDQECLLIAKNLAKIN
tara:strand:+ start:29 stop:757 length:729 start_codon:yes stop_codon:yes gene_type:complete